MFLRQPGAWGAASRRLLAYGFQARLPCGSSNVDDEAARQIAGQIQQAFPLWLVIWGTWSREWWAFPRLDAPKGTILHSSAADGLVQQIRATELALGVYRVHPR
jgi:hypothetical protein